VRSPLTPHLGRNVPSLSHVHLLTTDSNAVNLNHFRLLRVVGKGAFGKVRIVERKDTGNTFALKYIRKDEGATSNSPSLSPIAVYCVGICLLTRFNTCAISDSVVSQLFDPRVCETLFASVECWNS
jgi:serine/threonine protein kinase